MHKQMGVGNTRKIMVQINVRLLYLVLFTVADLIRNICCGRLAGLLNPPNYDTKQTTSLHVNGGSFCIAVKGGIRSPPNWWSYNKYPLKIPPPIWRGCIWLAAAWFIILSGKPITVILCDISCGHSPSPTIEPRIYTCHLIKAKRDNHKEVNEGKFNSTVVGQSFLETMMQYATIPPQLNGCFVRHFEGIASLHFSKIISN